MTDKVIVSSLTERDLIKNPTREEFTAKMKEVTLMQNSIANHKRVQWQKIGTDIWTDYIPGEADQPEFHDFNYRWKLGVQYKYFYMLIDEDGTFLRSYGWKDPAKAFRVLRKDFKSYKNATMVRFVLDRTFKPVTNADN